MSRLSIEIDPEQHRQIKTMATFKGKTIKEFILSRTLAEKRSSQDGKDVTEKLLAHPKNRTRLLDAISSPSGESRVFESMDDLKNALGV